jgi:hypothetical protein
MTPRGRCRGEVGFLITGIKDVTSCASATR